MSRLSLLVIGGVVVVGLAGGVWIGSSLASEGSESAGDNVEAPSTSTGSDAPGDTAQPDNTAEPTDETTGTAEPAEPVGASTCEFEGGEPLIAGDSVEMTELGEANGISVRGAIYPRPDYEGAPWTQWGQGIVVPGGRFISAIGDHLGPDGNSFVYVFDPETDQLTLVADVLSYVDHVPGTWGYGKIHSQMTLGSCGEVYFSTYWGTYRGIEFEGNYRGDLIFRLDPVASTLERMTVPVDLHGQASLAGAPGHDLIYGEAIDPVLKESDIDEGPFFAYDVTTGETVFEGPATPHVGFRAMIVDAEEKAYYSIGGRELAVFDPESNELGTHTATMPGEYLRAATIPAGDGSVYAVTEDPDAFFVMRSDGSIETLGEAPGYVASVALSDDGSQVYFMPGAHGNAWESGAALTALDTSTGEQTILVELNEMVEEGLGLTVGGTYNVAVSEDGEQIFVGINGSPVGDDSGFGEVALLVLDLP